MDRKLTEKEAKIIRNDKLLRKKLAYQLGVEPATVYDYAFRPNKWDTLSKLPIFWVTFENYQKELKTLTTQ